MLKTLVLIFLVVVLIDVASTQTNYGSYNVQASRPLVRATHNNVNIGTIKALEARIAAMEQLIKEFETKEILIREREQALEHRRIELEKLAADNERRIRDREASLDKKEHEITAYQNMVFKQQDEREQQLERSRRGREYQLDMRERELEKLEG